MDVFEKLHNQMLFLHHLFHTVLLNSFSFLIWFTLFAFTPYYICIYLAPCFLSLFCTFVLQSAASSPQNLHLWSPRPVCDHPFISTRPSKDHAGSSDPLFPLFLFPVWKETAIHSSLKNTVSLRHSGNAAPTHLRLKNDETTCSSWSYHFSPSSDKEYLILQPWQYEIVDTISWETSSLDLKL